MDYDDYLIWQEQRRFLYDCDCDGDCDVCDEEECECLAHEEDCPTCKTQRGCRCDAIYDEAGDR